MKAFGISTHNDLAGALEGGTGADRLLFDAKAPKNAALPGGNGLAFDWTILAGVKLDRAWMLSGGLDSENVAKAIALTGAPGFPFHAIEASPASTPR